MQLGISIVNAKGGAGKTTISIALADVLAELGERVLILDTDTRRNVVAWWKDCADKGLTRPNLTVASLYDASLLPKAIAEYFPQFDAIIFDTPGYVSDITAPCIALSSVMVSPVQMSKREIEGSFDANKLMKKEVANGRLPSQIPHLLVPTRINMTVVHTDISKQLTAFAAMINAKRSDASLTERNLYKDIQNGFPSFLHWKPSTPSQQDGHAKLAAEVLALSHEILNLAGYRPTNIPEAALPTVRARFATELT